MTPQQLLVQTQLAAGDGHLSSWHKKLIDDGKDLKKINDVGVIFDLILDIPKASFSGGFERKR